MKDKIFILCEGKSEQNYLKDIVLNHSHILKDNLNLLDKNIKLFKDYIFPPSAIKTKKEIFKLEIESLLKTFDEIYFLYDTDVYKVVQDVNWFISYFGMIYKGRMLFNVNAIDSKKIKPNRINNMTTYLNFDYFVALHFSDFKTIDFDKKIDNKTSEFKTVKKFWESFLIMKLKRNERKKWKTKFTLSRIKELGGDLENARRQQTKFKIFDIIK